MTPDCLAFLHAAQAKAQEVAEAARDAAGSPDWEALPDWGGVSACGPQGLMMLKGSQDSLEPELATHVAANDPAAVLRRIAAERKLIGECEAAHNWDNWGASSLANDVIRSLAASWGWTDAEHPPSV